MDIVKEKYSWVNGVLTKEEVPHKYIFYANLSKLCCFLFELIHHAHYKETWYGKKRLKTIQIYGLRKALVQNLSQRNRVIFYWKIGKYYI